MRAQSKRVSAGSGSSIRGAPLGARDSIPGGGGAVGTRGVFSLRDAAAAAAAAAAQRSRHPRAGGSASSVLIVTGVDGGGAVFGDAPVLMFAPPPLPPPPAPPANANANANAAAWTPDRLIASFEELLAADAPAPAPPTRSPAAAPPRTAAQHGHASSSSSPPPFVFDADLEHVRAQARAAALAARRATSPAPGSGATTLVSPTATNAALLRSPLAAPGAARPDSKQSHRPASRAAAATTAARPPSRSAAPVDYAAAPIPHAGTASAVPRQPKAPVPKQRASASASGNKPARRASSHHAPERKQRVASTEGDALPTASPSGRHDASPIALLQRKIERLRQQNERAFGSTDPAVSLRHATNLYQPPPPPQSHAHARAHGAGAAPVNPFAPYREPPLDADEDEDADAPAHSGGDDEDDGDDSSAASAPDTRENSVTRQPQPYSQPEPASASAYAHRPAATTTTTTTTGSHGGGDFGLGGGSGPLPLRALSPSDRLLQHVHAVEADRAANANPNPNPYANANGNGNGNQNTATAARVVGSLSAVEQYRLFEARMAARFGGLATRSSGVMASTGTTVPLQHSRSLSSTELGPNPAAATTAAPVAAAVSGGGAMSPRAPRPASPRTGGMRSPRTRNAATTTARPPSAKSQRPPAPPAAATAAAAAAAAVMPRHRSTGSSSGASPAMAARRASGKGSSTPRTSLTASAAVVPAPSGGGGAGTGWLRASAASLAQTFVDLQRHYQQHGGVAQARARAEREVIGTQLDAQRTQQRALARSKSDGPFFHRLPPDLWSAVLRWLDVRSVVQGAAHCSRSWRAACADPDAWHHVTIATDGNDRWLCEQLGDAQLASLCSAHGRWSLLQSLDLSHCKRLTDTGIRTLALNTPSLQTLKLARCAGVGDGALLYVARGACCATLQHLDVSHCERITDHGLQALASASGPPHSSGSSSAPGSNHGGGGGARLQLQSLDLTRCNKVTDAGLRHLGRVLPTLRSLNLTHCTRVTDDGVGALFGAFAAPAAAAAAGSSSGGAGSLDDDEAAASSSASAPRQLPLQELRLRWCPALTDRAVLSVVRACSHLERLYVDHCAQLTDACVAAVAGHLTASVGAATAAVQAGGSATSRASVSGSGLPKLRVFSAVYCPLLTDAAVWFLARAVCAATLERVALDYNPLISPARLPAAPPLFTCVQCVCGPAERRRHVAIEAECNHG